MSIVIEPSMSASASFLASARIQGRIVGALLLRELLTRFGRRNIGFLWLFLEPMLFTAGVLGIWTIYHRASPFPLTAFCISGYGTVLLWRNTIGRCGNAVEPNRVLMHHRNVRVIDLFLARIILEIAGASISFLALMTLFTLLGSIAPPDDLAKMILAWALLAWFSASMALIVGPLATISEPFERFWHIFAYLFLPALGAFLRSAPCRSRCSPSPPGSRRSTAPSCCAPGCSAPATRRTTTSPTWRRSILHS